MINGNESQVIIYQGNKERKSSPQPEGALGGTQHPFELSKALPKKNFIDICNEDIRRLQSH